MERRRIGSILIALGGLVLLVAIIYVLEAANGPGAGPTTFAERRSYNLVKRDVHAALPFAVPLALAGGLIAYAGMRMRRTDPRAEGE